MPRGVCPVRREKSVSMNEANATMIVLIAVICSVFFCFLVDGLVKAFDSMFRLLGFVVVRDGDADEEIEDPHHFGHPYANATKRLRRDSPWLAG